MEKLLAFVTSKPVSIIENENFFKKAFRFIFLFAAAVLAVYGIYSIISIAIDYFDFVFDLDAFPIIRHLLLFLLCLIISVLAYVLVIGAIYHRSSLIFKDTTTNLVDIMPGVFKTLGLVAAVIPLAIGLIGFLSALLAATPFFPMEELTGFLSGISFVDMPSVLSGYGVDGFKEYMEQLFSGGCVLLVFSIFSAFVNVVGMYLVAAIYKLVVDFVRK